MTRYKVELRKRGVKLECDYPYMPFDNYGKSYVTLEAVETGIDEDGLFVRTVYDVDITKTYFNRSLVAYKTY